jgi:hypothetical protein
MKIAQDLTCTVMVLVSLEVVTKNAKAFTCIIMVLVSLEAVMKNANYNGTSIT